MTALVRWQRRLLGICLVLFAFELGLILLVFPWRRNWDLNWLPLRFHALQLVWLNPYFRGAISGLGLLNMYVAILEAGRQIALFLHREDR